MADVRSRKKAQRAPVAKAAPRKTGRSKIVVPESLVVTFGTTKTAWFPNTANLELRGWKGSEHDLLARACKISGLSPERIVHEGIQLLAQRLIATALSDAHLTVSRGGVRGSADDRLAEGYKALKSAGVSDKDMTPSRLGWVCTPKVNYRSAKTWLKNKGILVEEGAS
jgi:hypothetical protein